MSSSESYAINPANDAQVPIFIADYVLAGYGTVIMAVPGHDQRDWEFAREFGLPIVEVIAGGDLSQAAYGGDGILVNSGYLNGLDVAAAKEGHHRASGTPTVVVGGASNISCATWLFARQRYWGEPFPIVLRR